MWKKCTECWTMYSWNQSTLWCSECRKEKDKELKQLGIDIYPKEHSYNELLAKYEQLRKDFAELVCDRDYCLDEIEFWKREAKKLWRKPPK